MDADDWNRKLDFERCWRTNSKCCRIIGLHNLDIFALAGREHSKFYAVLAESWSRYEVHRASGLPKSVVYSYHMYTYRNGTAASRLLTNYIAEAEYATMSLGAFLRAVHYGPPTRFAHDQMMSACVGRDALLQVPGVFIGQ